MLCEIAQTSRSGYYQWYIKRADKEKDWDDYLLIKEIFDKGKGKYGWRSIQMKLLDRGITMNHKKIQRIKRKYGLITKIRRRNPYKAVMKKTAEHRTFENILDRNFNQGGVNKVFSTDITYLSAIKDLTTKEIVASNLSMQINMDLVLKTLEKLKKNTSIPSLKDVLIHSDQGFHYTNPLYICSVKEMGMIQSMSRKGNCIDNAPIESFFGHFKDDVDYRSCKTFEELKIMVDEYMKYYNNQRHQWDIQKMTPVEYRNHLLLSV
jgi:transposase InsO family protein